MSVLFKIHCIDLAVQNGVCYLHDVFSDSADPNHCMVNISIYTWTARTAHVRVSPLVCRVDGSLHGTTVVSAAVMCAFVTASRASKRDFNAAC